MLKAVWQCRRVKATIQPHTHNVWATISKYGSGTIARKVATLGFDIERTKLPRRWYAHDEALMMICITNRIVVHPMMPYVMGLIYSAKQRDINSQLRAKRIPKVGGRTVAMTVFPLLSRPSKTNGCRIEAKLPEVCSVSARPNYYPTRFFRQTRPFRCADRLSWYPLFSWRLQAMPAEAPDLTHYIVPHLQTCFRYLMGNILMYNDVTHVIR